jgi:hypothetical protein
VLELEGMRRTVYDIIVFVLHLVLSNFTFEGVDTDMANRIVRYPEGTRYFTHVSMIKMYKK